MAKYNITCNGIDLIFDNEVLFHDFIQNVIDRNLSPIEKNVLNKNKRLILDKKVSEAFKPEYFKEKGITMKKREKNKKDARNVIWQQNFLEELIKYLYVVFPEKKSLAIKAMCNLLDSKGYKDYKLATLHSTVSRLTHRQWNWFSYKKVARVYAVFDKFGIDTSDLDELFLTRYYKFIEDLPDVKRILIKKHKYSNKLFDN